MISIVGYVMVAGVNANFDRLFTTLTWWFVPAVIGLAVPLAGVFLWWLAGGALAAKAMQSLDLLLDAVGFFMLAYTLLGGRSEYESGRNPSYGKIKWTEKFEYIDEYSRADVAFGKLGIGMVLAGFAYQFIGVLQN